MPAYQLQIKQVVDYPRCRIYRQFVHRLMADRIIRTSGGSGLFYFKIILNLEDDEAERVQETLHLSDAETMEVTHFERGSGLISTNNNNIMVEFKASPLEKDLITTDRRELRELLERKRQEQADSA